MTASTRNALALAATLTLAACGGGGGDGGGGGNGGDAALQAEIDTLFPYTANQPLDVLFQCGRANSQLTYYFGFSPNMSFVVFFETDTRQQVSFNGTYTHSNGAIHMTALNNNILPLDETTVRLVPHLGMVGELYTANMACGAVAHGYNDPAVENHTSFACPAIHVGAASFEQNFFEFADSSSPFPVQFRGGIFRHREVSVQGNPNPIIARASGIYRRRGNAFYADFANQFNDVNLLKGSFTNGDQQMSIDQLEPQSGPCTRR